MKGWSKTNFLWVKQFAQSSRLSRTVGQKADFLLVFQVSARKMFQNETPKLGAVLSEIQLLLQSHSSKPDYFVCFELLTKMQRSIENEPKVINSIFVYQNFHSDSFLLKHRNHY